MSNSGCHGPGFHGLIAGGLWGARIVAMSALFCISIDDLPKFDERLIPLLQAVILMEESGISRDAIDRSMRRAYMRMVHTEALARVHNEFFAALAEARQRIRRNGSEGTCQLADLTQDVTH